MSEPIFSPQCPVPITGETIEMAHGGGGRLTKNLLERIVRPILNSDSLYGDSLQQETDAAVLGKIDGRVVFTTDSYVVSPRFFPSGDIGTLAVNGTLNDLAMMAAQPLWLSIGLIIEEGFSIAELQTILRSIANSARAAGVAVVTGDTKVVERGRGDGLYICASGIGVIRDEIAPNPSAIAVGDAIIISGDIGRHGIAVMAAREGLNFTTPIHSDCQNLYPLVAALQAAHCELHCLRDLTRGGLSAALVELAEKRGLQFLIDETAVPVIDPVRGVCEVLGLDPFFVANEGRFIAFVPKSHSDLVLAQLRALPGGEQAASIGVVQNDNHGVVLIENAFGLRRPLDLPNGEQLPRIC